MTSPKGVRRAGNGKDGSQRHTTISLHRAIGAIAHIIGEFL